MSVSLNAFPIELLSMICSICSTMDHLKLWFCGDRLLNHKMGPLGAIQNFDWPLTSFRLPAFVQHLSRLRDVSISSPTHAEWDSLEIDELDKLPRTVEKLYLNFGGALERLMNHHASRPISERFSNLKSLVARDHRYDRAHTIDNNFLQQLPTSLEALKINPTTIDVALLDKIPANLKHLDVCLEYTESASSFSLSSGLESLSVMFVTAKVYPLVVAPSLTSLKLDMVQKPSALLEILPLKLLRDFVVRDSIEAWTETELEFLRDKAVCLTRMELVPFLRTSDLNHLAELLPRTLESAKFAGGFWLASSDQPFLDRLPPRLRSWDDMTFHTLAAAPAADTTTEHALSFTPLSSSPATAQCSHLSELPTPTIPQLLLLTLPPHLEKLSLSVLEDAHLPALLALQHSLTYLAFDACKLHASSFRTIQRSFSRLDTLRIFRVASNVNLKRWFATSPPPPPPPPQPSVLSTTEQEDDKYDFFDDFTPANSAPKEDDDVAYDDSKDSKASFWDLLPPSLTDSFISLSDELPVVRLWETPRLLELTRLTALTLSLTSNLGPLIWNSLPHSLTMLSVAALRLESSPAGSRHALQWMENFPPLLESFRANSYIQVDRDASINDALAKALPRTLRTFQIRIVSTLTEAGLKNLPRGLGTLGCLMSEPLRSPSCDEEAIIKSLPPFFAWPNAEGIPWYDKFVERRKLNTLPQFTPASQSQS